MQSLFAYCTELKKKQHCSVNVSVSVLEYFHASVIKTHACRIVSEADPVDCL